MKILRDVISAIRGTADDDGVEQKEHEAPQSDQQVTLAKEGRKTLFELPPSAVAKMIRKRWDRHEHIARRTQAQIKVNFLRYNGQPFVQVHPEDPNRVYIPPGASQRLPPTINKIRRSVHRYVAQVTADEPIMEALPVNHTDAARDAAEAGTHVLRGEWHRMKLQNELQRTAELTAVMRSGFWFFEFDRTAGGRVKAQKFFADPNGERYLAYVDGKGNRVDSEEQAAEIWQGDTRLHVLTPNNVRWEGARYAHDAEEVIVGLLITLRQLYEMAPETRAVRIKDLICDVPPDAEKWLQDIRGESPEGFNELESEIDESLTGEGIGEEDSKLDSKVFLRHYFLKRSRTYSQGFHGLLAGKHLVFRKPLRYGLIPVAHFKLLEAIADRLGMSLVDLLRDPQELLDFVNGQILRYLQTMKRRWFVPMHSGVKPRDLLNPTRSVIEYNPQAGEPKPEQHSEIPNSLVNWVDRFDRAYDDELGIHDTMKGKHVPGVSSGRHAEALRTGDETLLGLSRAQIKEGLEAASRIVLAISKKEWTKPRRVHYMGEDREYVDQAFSATDISDTSQTQLKRGTLLMLTQSQKTETLYAAAEMQAIPPAELRRLLPLSDTAGISLSEDPHYKRARRQNQRFLSGPPKPLLAAFEDYEEKMGILEKQINQFEQMALLQADPVEVQTALDRIAVDVEVVEQEWQGQLQQYAPDHRGWEDDPSVARIHAIEHQRALASDKAERFPEWWVELFEQHAIFEAQIGQLIPPPAPAVPAGGGAPPPVNADGTMPPAPAQVPVAA